MRKLKKYFCTFFYFRLTDQVGIAGRGRKKAICTLTSKDYTSNMADQTNLVVFIMLPKILRDLQFAGGVVV